MPFTEKLCGTLKTLAKSKANVKLLWEEVLKKAERDLGRVSHRVVGECWSALVLSNRICSEEGTNTRASGYSDIRIAPFRVQFPSVRQQDNVAFSQGTTDLPLLARKLIDQIR